MERLQILITKQQRERLERRARDEGTSVTAVVREAIDELLPARRTRQESMAALARLRAMPSVRMPPPEELRKMIDDTKTEEILRGIP